jgi:hypothetical protein
MKESPSLRAPAKVRHAAPRDFENARRKQLNLLKICISVRYCAGHVTIQAGLGSHVMSRPTVKEINYVDFKRILERAAALGTRVELSDKSRWSAFVAQHRVKEAGFGAYARSHSDSLKPVIIDEPEPDGGYYLYSDRDEVCLKWIARLL